MSFGKALNALLGKDQKQNTGLVDKYGNPEGYNPGVQEGPVKSLPINTERLTNYNDIRTDNTSKHILYYSKNTAKPNENFNLLNKSNRKTIKLTRTYKNEDIMDHNDFAYGTNFSDTNTEEYVVNVLPFDKVLITNPANIDKLGAGWSVVEDEGNKKNIGREITDDDFAKNYDIYEYLPTGFRGGKRKSLRKKRCSQKRKQRKTGKQRK